MWIIWCIFLKLNFFFVSSQIFFPAGYHGPLSIFFMIVRKNISRHAIWSVRHERHATRATTVNTDIDASSRDGTKLDYYLVHDYCAVPGTNTYAMSVVRPVCSFVDKSVLLFTFCWVCACFVNVILFYTIAIYCVVRHCFGNTQRRVLPYRSLPLPYGLRYMDATIFLLFLLVVLIVTYWHCTFIK